MYIAMTQSMAGQYSDFRDLDTAQIYAPSTQSSSIASCQQFHVRTSASRRQPILVVVSENGELWIASDTSSILGAWAIVDAVFVVAVALVVVGLLVRWKWREFVEYLGGALESEGGAEESWEKERSAKNCSPAKAEGVKNWVEGDGTEDRRRKEAWTKYLAKLRGEEEIRRENGVKEPWKKERWMQNGPKSAWTKERWTKHGWLEER